MAAQFAVPSIVASLQMHAQLQPEKTAFIFLANGEIEKEKLTYQELDKKSRQIAQQLQLHANKGDRILLCYLPGLDFICAFMGCLYAQMIAVPAFSLRNNRHAQRLMTMVDDCQVKMILSTQTLIESMRLHERFRAMNYLATDKIPEIVSVSDDFLDADISLETLAFLQYTSGSTGNPKGVMVSHGNIAHNMRCLEVAFGYDQTENKVSAFWIPVQHDMSLIGEILINMFVGGTAIMLTPTAFIERPLNWLKAISHYRAHYAAAPNFAYDLCAEKITEVDKQNLDLSCWRVAMNASEPVRWKTLENFCNAFQSCGFTLTQFMPAYGLAEVTLLISGTACNSKPALCILDKTCYEKAEVKIIEDFSTNNITLTSSGKVLWGDPAQEIKIVDPETLMECTADKMGEVWIKSVSVAQGYWQKNEETQKNFKACLINNDGPYLRTGDLGFIHKDELYITGRIKDIIIIQGRNIYPQDVEAAVETCHLAIRLDCTAAFSIEVEGQEKVIIVAEIERTARKQNTREIFNAIRKAVIESCEIAPYSIQLLQPAQALKTTSGKIQRQATKRAYLEGALKILAVEDATESVSSSDDLTADIIKIYQDILKIKDISLTEKFSTLGGDSFKATLIYEALSRYLGNDTLLSLSVAFDYPSLNELIRHMQKIKAKEKNSNDVKDNEVINELDERIAIIGMSCRFPGDASDIESFWQLLVEGKDSFSEIPADRWELDGFYDPNPENNNISATKHGAFLKNIKEFDADFFGVAPIEAQMMDPQQRILLETTWHALENAGINPCILTGTDTSVFIGAMAHEYGDILLKHNQHSNYFATGNTLSVLAGRVSYFLGLQGSSETIDTACSSALVALHDACSSLKLGETSLAIVGGVNALLSPDTFINLSQAHMLSTGRECKVFSEDADGYVRGEGCGVVILKRLCDAKKDHDNILAVIRSVVVNQDGASSGLTVPNGVSQEHLLLKGLQKAKLQTQDIDYIEAHGTGTKIGDPMEMHALSDVYHNSHSNHELYIGSVKANIGHLEAAAGMAGLIKVILSFQNQMIPPHRLVNTINSKIHLENIPAQIPQQAIAWPRNNKKARYAGISAFGFSGTNTHVILEEPPLISSNENLINRGEYLLIISAKNKQSLECLINDYIDYLKNTEHNIKNICYTAQFGRSLFEHQFAVLGSTKEALAQKLTNGEYATEQQIKDNLLPNTLYLHKVSLPNYRFNRKPYWPENFAVDSNEHYKLSLGNKHTLADIHVAPHSLSTLKEEEVLIAVDYTGMNLRDLLTIMGIYSGLCGEIGLECAGRILAVGAKVNNFVIGDEIFGVAPGSYADAVIVNQNLILHKPENITLQQAATLPIAYLTTYYALHDIAKLKPQAKILIHAAAGGVGLAAVCVAQAVGAQVYATVGNDEKRHYLESLGVTHIYNSRNTDFSKQIMQDTSNQGVDVVLNSLTSDGFIAASLACCALKARFIELGRVNTWSSEQIRDVREDVNYHILNIDDLIVKNPENIQHYLELIKQDTLAGLIKPLPYNTFAIDQIKDGFAFLQQAKNIGKVLIASKKLFQQQEKIATLSEVNINDTNSVHDFICAQVGDVLGLSPNQIDETRGFFALGMDSLTAAELNKRLKTALGESVLTTTSVFDFPNIEALCLHINEIVSKNDSAQLSDNVIASAAEIAIIGMSCRMPGANSVEEFWNLLLSDKDPTQPLSEARKGLVFSIEDTNYVGNFINDVDKFDANFFGISPRDAQLIDPQQRLLLQVSWEALEQAGIVQTNLATGVFIGAANTDYGNLLDRTQNDDSEKNANRVTGTLLSALAGRLSYILGLQGPCLTIDTACSSSLVALHEACASLRVGDCKVALVGGVNLILDPNVFARFQQAGILSPSNHCQTFDAKADGYARGEGCGVVILKPLSAARHDEDTILAVIKGTGVNQDGSSSGFTVPNGSAQVQLMQQVLDKTDLKPETISYIETHGTGTSLGDPIEVNAIGEVYGQGHTNSEAVILGALKSRIGHLETASGIASLIKVIECLRHQAIPKNRNYTQLNPHINLEINHVQLALENKPWVPDSLPRRAAISSFGFTGTNAHVIVEEASHSQFQQSIAGPYLLIISAKTPEAFAQQKNRYIHYLKTTKDTIQDICFTSQRARKIFEYKEAFLGADMQQLVANLEKNDSVPIESMDNYLYPTEIKLRKVDLPSYPFASKSYWAKQIQKDTTHNLSSHKKNKDAITQEQHPLLGEGIPLSLQGGMVFTTDVTRDYPNFINDHTVFDIPILSGPAYISAIISALYAEKELLQGELEHLDFLQPLAFSDENQHQLQIYVGNPTITVQSRKADAENWAMHATAKISLSENNNDETINFGNEIQQLPQINTYHLTKTQLYDEFMRKKGTGLQGHSCWVEELWGTKNKILARLRLPGSGESIKEGFILHPGCIESCIYLAAVLQNQQSENASEVLFLPYAIEKIHYKVDVHDKPMWAYVEFSNHASNSEIFQVNAYLLNHTGNIILSLQGLWLKMATPAAIMQSLKTDSVEPKSSKTNEPIISTSIYETTFDNKQILDILRSQTSILLGINHDELESKLEIGFMDMGMDSLGAVELAKELKGYFGETIIPNATVLYNYPNIKALSEYINTFYTQTPVVNKIQKSVIEPHEAIAIIGMSARFPAANSIQAFWQLLAQGNSGIIEVPKERWDINEYYDPDPNVPGKMCSRNGGFLNIPIENFDAAFFGITPREANYLDPQQRLLLECSWEAIENAGINANHLRGSRTGVYIGIWTSDYNQLLGKTSDLTDLNPYSALGGGLAEAAGRISYTLGLQGPSVAIDTVCSSSLVALHQACQGLQTGDCDSALVGGVNLLLDPATSVGFSQLHMLSPEGYCKTFDAKANGYVRGEGCGIIVLKRLSDAKSAGDNILAVIRASGVNQDGASSGFTAPNGTAQQRLMREVLQRANLAPHEISYLETHGTATELGDPIEVSSIKAVYGENRTPENPLILGALKTNIGHLEAAAGVASVTKVVLALQHELVPANLHFDELNGKIDINSIPAIIPTKTQAWTHADNKKRFAAINAFGASGTNAHVILEEAPLRHVIETPITQKQNLLLISAKTATALQQQIQNYVEFLKNTHENIQNICYTAQVGRCQFEYKVAVLGDTVAELISNLETKKFLEFENIKQYLYPAETKLNKVTLPTYAFERQAYWVKDLHKQQKNIHAEKGLHPLLGQPIRISAVDGIVFNAEVSQQYPDFIADHQAFALPIVSGPAYISAMISSLLYEQNSLTGHFTDINFLKPLVLSDNDTRELQIYLGLDAANTKNISIQSRKFSKEHAKTPWTLHASAKLSLEEGNTQTQVNLAEKIANLPLKHTQHLSKADFYDIFLREHKINARGHSSWIEELWINNKEGLGRLRLPATGESKKDGYLLHPGCIESCVYLAALLRCKRLAIAVDISYLPFAIENVNYTLTAQEEPRFVYVAYDDADTNNEVFKVNAYLLNATGNVLLELKGLWLKAAQESAILQSLMDNNAPEIAIPISSTPVVEEKLQMNAAEVFEIVRSQASVVLGITPETLAVQSDKGFMDLGMDSLMAVELSNQLKIYFGEKIIPNATILYNYPSVKILCDYINHFYEEKTPQPKVATMLSTHSAESIAIIGMSGRFPGAASVQAFWDLLSNGQCAVTDVPADRWDINALYDADPDAPGKMCTRKGAFLNVPLADFDAEFFGISRREASSMDPQQRLLLETSWEALEDAGISPNELIGTRTGVYVGIWSSDYSQLIAKKGQLTDINPYSGVGGGLAEAAGRISYLLGLQGPSVAIDTVCSSSLVALHEACLGLQAGDCDTVLLGGVNILLDPATSIGFSKMHLLAPDGYCKTFDASANGYVRGEGCVVLVLKRLQDAQRDGDTILAAIKASGINQDGASSGFTAPNGPAQEKLLTEVLAKANLNPNDISYLETHGTATELGDPIEVNAIKNIYSKDRSVDSPLILGAVKTNIGHLEAAAGIASVTKVVLSMQHEKIPANLHFQTLNEKIDIASIPAMIPVKPCDWKKDEHKTRYAAVSGFGATGTNVHVILEEAHNKFEESQIMHAHHLLMLSAKTETAMQQQMANYITFLKTTTDKIQNICYTTQRGRNYFTEYNINVVGKDIAELITNLESKIFATADELYTLQYPKEVKLQKVKLPHYPFQHKHYWSEILQSTLVGLPSATNESHYQLSFTGKNTLEDISFNAYSLRALESDEVLVQIECTGVNLRDVLAVMGVYQAFAGAIGLECSGRVLAIGNQATRFKIGDEVLGIALGSYADVVIVKQDLLVAKPYTITYEQAATLPIAYFTAYYALKELAQLKSGDKILIHAAAGGVGLAAVYIAKWLGTEIYATVGSEEKRKFLHSLGVQNIYNSRDTTFAEKILADTQQKGVDVVLNSLTTSGFISASITSCAKAARFVEIGRVNIWTPEEMTEARPDIQYTIMQIDDVIANRAAQIQLYLQEVIEAVKNGHLPPLPYKIFVMPEVKNAFAYLQQAKNIGKVIVKSVPMVIKVSQTICAPLNIDNSSYIRSQVEEVLGLQTGESVDMNKDFTELGFDSLMMVELANRLKNLPDVIVEISAKTIYEHPTVTKLINFISDTNDAKTETYTPLRCIKTQGEKSALFCIHGVDGHAEIFTDLAKNTQINRPIYAFQGLESAYAISINTIEERAELYIEAMQKIQPHGPYYILGWSMGGAIALEVTRQLLAQEEQVAFLGVADGMIKADNIDKQLTFKEAAKFYLYIYGHDIQPVTYEKLEAVNDDDLIKLIQENLTIKTKSPEEIKNEITIVKNNFNQLLCYTASSVHQPLVLFSPKNKKMEECLHEFNPLLRGSASIEWQKMSSHSVKKHIVDGDHFSMLDLEHSIKLGKYLQKYLSES